MSTRRILFLICIVSISAQTADAGPSNIHAKQGPSQSNVPVNLNGFGAPLPGVAQHSSDLNVFATGQINFKEIDALPQVGPIMNGVSCAGCHSQPAIGGGGLFINEIRVRNNTQPGPVHIFAVDNFLRNGPQMQGNTAIFPKGIEGEPPPRTRDSRGDPECSMALTPTHAAVVLQLQSPWPIALPGANASMGKQISATPQRSRAVQRLNCLH
jgi:hypothetical protein